MKSVNLPVEASYESLDAYLKKLQVKNLLLVCGKSIEKQTCYSYFTSLDERLGITVSLFQDFTPNPTYESVVQGVKYFLENQCDGIAAVGGGSAMDVAKCIKLYSNMDHEQNYLTQTIVPNEIPLIAIPTTAGTGSEATRYAVIYYKGEKQSVTHESCIPLAVLLDPDMLRSLPEYQRKVTMLDALCHAIESFWSVHATQISQSYAREAIQTILRYKDEYLDNTAEGNSKMLYASHLAGKAINITQTTAGHAMSYKLTSLYGIAHGHAAALCVNKLWPFMLKTDKRICTDPRGMEYLQTMFVNLSNCMGAEDAYQASKYFSDFLKELKLEIPMAKEADYDVLCTSVNPVRLKNHPVKLEHVDIEELYHQILER